MPKIIVSRKPYQGKEPKYQGKTFTEFHVVAENGMKIQIKPCFKNDYRSLEALSTKE